MPGLTYESLVDVLRVRFDAPAARAVLEEMLGQAGLGLRPDYQPADVLRLADHVAARSDQIEDVIDLLRAHAWHASRKGAINPAVDMPDSRSA